MSTRTEDVTTATSSADVQRPRRSRRTEAVVAAIVFVMSCVVILWFTVLGQLGHPEDVWSVVLFFVLLVGSYIGLSVTDARDCLRSALAGPLRSLVIGPALLLGTALVYAQATGLPVWPRAVGLAAYLGGPVALLILRQWTGKGASAFLFGAALALWLPIEFGLLPSDPSAVDGQGADELTANVASDASRPRTAGMSLRRRNRGERRRTTPMSTPRRTNSGHAALQPARRADPDQMTHDEPEIA